MKLSTLIATILGTVVLLIAVAAVMLLPTTAFSATVLAAGAAV